MVAGRLRQIRGALGLLLAGAGCLIGALAAQAAQVLPLSVSETVRQADAIVVGTITGRQSRWGDASRRWIETDYSLAVEDVLYASEQGLRIRDSMQLTFWGGTIGEETQSVGDIRMPADGERVLIMLHPRWAQRGSITPAVGFNQGLFSVEADAGGYSLLRDGEGRLLVMGSGGDVVRGGADRPSAAGAQGVDLAGLRDWLRERIAAIKAAPSDSRPRTDPDDARVLKVFAKTPAPLQPPAPLAFAAGADAVAPLRAPAADTVQVVRPVAGEPRLAAGSAGAAMARDARVARKYSTAHQAHAPIIVNNFSPSLTPWAPEDQYQMAKWNYYATDVFLRYTTPTGAFGWPDGVFDLSGWPSDADMQRVYGTTWYCGAGCQTLGVTLMRFDGGGWIVEADLALNPDVTWTLDDEWVFDGGAATSFRHTMMHELGHMHGLDHNFSYPALMNYFQPSRYRSFPFPYMDDAAGIRFEYPSRAVALTDLAVYLYYETRSCYDGTQFFTCIAEATYPNSVLAGGNLGVSNYQVENAGTTTIAAPTIEWYLTSRRNYESSYHYIGQSVYSALAPFTSFTPGSVQRTFQVPADVPAGSYYLAAYIRNDGGPTDTAFPFGNNYAFSRNTIRVLHPGSLQFSQAAQTVSEAGGSATVQVTRENGDGGDVSVPYLTFNGSGAAGTNYLAKNGTLYWPDGDSTPKFFTVSILNDGVAAGNKTFYASFNVPSGGATLGNPADQVVTIADVAAEVWPANCLAPAGFATPAGATTGWSVATDAAGEGGCSLRSDALGNSPGPGQVVTAQVAYSGMFADGVITFARRVSSEYFFDCLRFSIDGTEQSIGVQCGAGNGASGTVPWGPVSVPVTAGAHSLLWSFERDDSVGVGANSAWIDSVAFPLFVPAAPGAPEGVSALAGAQLAVVSFAAPPNDGGSAITGYTATCTPSAGAAAALAGPGSPIEVPGLVNGTTYTCTARAANGIGDGPESAPSNPVTPSAAAPAVLAVTLGGSGTGNVASMPGGIACPGDCAQSYSAGTGVVLTATPTGGSVFTGWLGACAGAGSTCTVTIGAGSAVSATFAAPATPATLDADLSAPGSKYDALTDGMLVFRYTLGLSGSALTNGALGGTALRNTAGAILTYLADIRPLLDVDGDGQVEAMTDGLLILRHLFGLTGAALTGGAVGADARRTAPEQITPYLQSLMP